MSTKKRSKNHQLKTGTTKTTSKVRIHNTIRAPTTTGSANNRQLKVRIAKTIITRSPRITKKRHTTKKNQAAKAQIS